MLRQVTLIKGLIYSLLIFALGGTGSRTPPADGVQERGTWPQDRALPEGRLLSHEGELEGVACDGSPEVGLCGQGNSVLRVCRLLFNLRVKFKLGEFPFGAGPSPLPLPSSPP